MVRTNQIARLLVRHFEFLIAVNFFAYSTWLFPAFLIGCVTNVLDVASCKSGCLAQEI